MRLKLKLKLISKQNKIPLNYNYHFSSAIYLLLKYGSKEFSEFLHDYGYQLNGKKFKLFTFSVSFESMKIEETYIALLKPYVYLTISSPMLEPFIKSFVIGSFVNQKMTISYKEECANFIIQQMEALPAKEFTDEVTFRMLSPLVCSKMKLVNGRLSQYYYRYDDFEIIYGIQNNLIKKYNLIYNKSINPKFFEFEFDKDEIERRNGRVSKLITISEGKPTETKIKSILCSFRKKTDPELIKVGYECGFGEKNSMGFGMVETINGLN